MATARAGAAGGRVTQFWCPKALCRELKVDGPRPNAIGYGLSANHIKPKGKLEFFMVRRCSGACFGELFSCFFGSGHLVVDVWVRFGDFGSLCVGFGVLFGGFGWPLGAQRLDQGPLAGRDRMRPRCG